MAEARQREDWTRAARMTAEIANAVRLSGKPLDPLTLVPPQFRPKPAPPPEWTEEERAAEWDRFDAAFGIKSE